MLFLVECPGLVACKLYTTVTNPRFPYRNVGRVKPSRARLFPISHGLEIWTTGLIGGRHDQRGSVLCTRFIHSTIERKQPKQFSIVFIFAWMVSFEMVVNWVCELTMTEFHLVPLCLKKIKHLEDWNVKTLNEARDIFQSVVSERSEVIRTKSLNFFKAHTNHYNYLDVLVTSGNHFTSRYSRERLLWYNTRHFKNSINSGPTH